MRIPVILPINPSAQDEDLEAEILQRKFTRIFGIWKSNDKEFMPIFVHIGKIYRKEFYPSTGNIKLYYLGLKSDKWIIDLFFGFFWQFLYYLKHVINRNPFIIFLSAPYVGLAAVLIKKMYNRPILCVRVMGDTPRHLKEVSGLKTTSNILEKIEKLTLKNSDIIVANSLLTKELALKRGGKKENIINIPSPIFDFQKPDKAILNNLRKKFGEDKIILTAARLVELKGIQYLIKAMKIVLEEHSNCKLVIVGDGGYRNQLEKLTADYGLDDHVFFEGYVDHGDIFSYFHSSDIFVLPSIAREGRPTVITEAGLCKKAVIATFEAGNCVINDGKDGFLVFPRDEKELAKKVTELLSDENKRKKFGDALYENVIEYHESRDSTLKILEKRISMFLNDPE